jgi:hypothetical protein
MTQELVSLAEAAKAYGVGIHTLQKYLGDGTVVGRQLPGKSSTGYVWHIEPPPPGWQPPHRAEFELADPNDPRYEGWLTAEAAFAAHGGQRGVFFKSLADGRIPAVRIPGGTTGVRWLVQPPTPTNGNHPDTVRPSTTTIAAPAPVPELDKGLRFAEEPVREWPLPIDQELGLIEVFMAERGVTWADLAAHLGLSVNPRQLVRTSVGQHSNPTQFLVRAVLQAQHNEGNSSDAALTAKLKDYETQLGDYQALLKVDHTQIQQANLELEQLQGQVQSLKKQLADSGNAERFNQLRHELESLRVRYADAVTNGEAHSKNATALTKKLGETEQLLKIADEENQTTGRELDHLRSLNAQLEAELGRAREALARKSTQNGVDNGMGDGVIGPVMVSRAVLSGLKLVLPPIEHHGSGHGFKVKNLENIEDLVAQMRRQPAKQDNLGPAINWVLGHRAEYLRAVRGDGFVDTEGKAWTPEQA